MQNFITLGQPLVGEKYVAQKRKERKIIPNIVDTSFRSNAHELGIVGKDIGFEVFWCDVCPLTFRRKSDLYDHIRVCHEEEYKQV